MTEDYFQTFASTAVSTPQESFAWWSTVTATNPIPNTGNFTISSSSPQPMTRVLYGIFAPYDNVVSPSATYNFLLTITPNVPSITAVNQLVGDVAGGYVITLTGTFEQAGKTSGVVNGGATIGGLACSPVSYDAFGKILCTVPAGEGTNKEIIVTLFGLSSAPYPLYFNYNPPTVTRISPTNGPTIANNTVTIIGTGFGPSTIVSVSVSGNCPVLTRNTTMIRCLMPPGYGYQTVSVSVSGQPSGSVTYSYDAPTTSASQCGNTATIGGAYLFIWGTNFGTAAATLVVTVGGNTATPINSHNHTFINCTLPPGAGLSQAIVVSMNVVPVLTNAVINQFINYIGPTITLIAPSPVPPLITSITLMGINFGPSTVSTTITLLGGPCTPTGFRNHSYLVCTPTVRSAGTPPGAVLIIASQQSATFPLAYTPPVLVGLSPTNGPTSGNLPIGLGGTSLYGADVAVSLNSVPVSITFQNDTFVIWTVPQGSGKSLPLVLTVGGFTSNALLFSYQPPTITSVTFTSGGFPVSGPTPDGTSVALITGTNFGTTGTISLTTGQTCSPISWGTFITCTFPAGVGVANFSISVASQLSPSFVVSYVAPVVTQVQPAAGVPTDGSVAITVRGTYFGLTKGTSSVILGPKRSTCTVTSWSDTIIICTPPAGNGTNLLANVTAGGQTGGAYLFNYLPPTISAATAPSYPTTGSTALVITGISFDDGGSVTVGGVACPVTAWSQTSITCTWPAGSGASRPIVITTVANAVSDGLYTLNYDSPSITSSNPTTFSSAGQSIILGGSNFGNVNANIVVSVNGQTSGNTVTASSHNSLTFTLGSAPSGSNNAIIVTVSGQPSATYYIGQSLPIISTVSPSSGVTGPTYNVTVTGANFGSGAQTTTLSIGSNQCPIIELTPTKIVCLIAADSGSAAKSVSLTVGSLSSNTDKTFTFLPPSVFSATPTTNLLTSGGQTLVIAGQSFGTPASAPSASVSIGGTACTITSRNHTIILCTTPASTGTGLVVSVTVTGQTSVQTSVTVSYEPPVITSISPVNGTTAGGDTLVITGTGFGGGGAQAGSVTLNGFTCTVILASYTYNQISCTTPANMGTGMPVIVTVGGRASNTAYFNSLPPSTTGVTPQSGSTAGGTTVTISGSNFGTAGTVLFNGTTQCLVIQPSDYGHSSIKCTLPAGAGTVPVTVTSNGYTTSTSLTYTYGSPTLTSVTPLNGPTIGGTTIVIVGTNLYTTGSVTVGGVACPLTGTGWSQTRIVCSTPAGPGGSAAVRVVVGGQPVVYGSSFVYDTPAVYAISPTTGATNALLGGQPAAPLTVWGTNFGTPATSITIAVGGVQCGSVSVHNHTYAVCNSIPNGVGTGLSVTVTTASGTSTANTLYSYTPPRIDTITGCPTTQGSTTVNCPITGNITLSLTGSNFGPLGASVTVNFQPCTNLAYTDASGTKVTCTLPAGVSFNLPVTLTVGTQASTPAMYISYAGPTLTTNSLTLNTPAAIRGAGGSMSLSTITGGETIHFNGTFLSPWYPSTPYPTNLKYGIAGATKIYTCLLVAYDNTQVSCTLQSPSVGRNLVFVYNDGLQDSIESVDTVTFGAVAVVPGTIAVPNGAPGTNLPGSSSSGQYIQFKADNVGSDASVITITYDLPNGTSPLACVQVSVISFNATAGRTLLQCLSQPGNGNGYVFTVTAYNSLPATGTDTYNYPTSPVVTKVQGDSTCVNTATATTCPTAGSALITITGTSFATIAADNNVQVGVGNCLVTSASANQLICILPPGTGQSTAVTVYSNNLVSQAAYLVSYTKATLTSITGCPVASGNWTANCPRSGGTSITLIGRNFGPSGAIVLIGANQCTGVVHDFTTPHTKLTCTTPHGVAVDTSVLFIQSSGTLGSNSGLLSYLQCATGYYQASTSDYNCTICGAGTYTDTAGSLSCKSCSAGSITATAGLSVCSPCLAGKYAPAGSSNCTSCTPGSYSPSVAQTACSECAPYGYHTSQRSSPAFAANVTLPLL